MARRAAAALLLAAARAEERCESDPKKFKPPPVYKLVRKPPWCEAPYGSTVLSMSECTEAARLLIARGAIEPPEPRERKHIGWTPNVTAKAAPSAMLGRNLPIGCYWYNGRMLSGYDALFWNGGQQVHGTPVRAREQSLGSAAAAVCKHDDAAAAVAALASADWGLEPLLPATTPHQAAEVLHILSGDEEAHLHARDLLGGGGTDPFADVANEQSLCTTAPLGGALGVVMRGQLVPPLNSAIFDGEAEGTSFRPVVWRNDGGKGTDTMGRHHRKGVAIYFGSKSALGFHIILVRWLGEPPEEEPHVIAPYQVRPESFLAARKREKEAKKKLLEPKEEDGQASEQATGEPAVDEGVDLRGTGSSTQGDGPQPRGGSIRELEEAMRVALAAEEYETAAELKAAIAAQQAAEQNAGEGGSVDELKKAMDAAIAGEDYERAAELKAAIAALRPPG